MTVQTAYTAEASPELVQQETATQYQEQAAIAVAALAAIAALWRTLNPADVDADTESWIAAALDKTQRLRNKSARSAAGYLDRTRALALPGAEPFDHRILTSIDADAFRTSMLVTGPYRYTKLLSEGRTREQAAQIARASTGGAAVRHALAGGRETVNNAVTQDRAVLGYARQTGPTPCYFCAMLASAGPRYKSDKSFDASDARFGGKSNGTARVHDHCSCLMVPVYRDDLAWPGESRRFESLWRDATNGVNGSRNQLIAFRRAYEGRA